MEHSEADRKLAAEGYVLGDMSGCETEEFEKHLFVCTKCADAVLSGTVFLDEARESLGSGLGAIGGHRDLRLLDRKHVC